MYRDSNRSSPAWYVHTANILSPCTCCVCHFHYLLLHNQFWQIWRGAALIVCGRVYSPTQRSSALSPTFTVPSGYFCPSRYSDLVSRWIPQFTTHKKININILSNRLYRTTVLCSTVHSFMLLVLTELWLKVITVRLLVTNVLPSLPAVKMKLAACLGSDRCSQVEEFLHTFSLANAGVGPLSFWHAELVLL